MPLTLSRHDLTRRVGLAVLAMTSTPAFAWAQESAPTRPAAPPGESQAAPPPPGSDAAGAGPSAAEGGAAVEGSAASGFIGTAESGEPSGSVASPPPATPTPARSAPPPDAAARAVPPAVPPPPPAWQGGGDRWYDDLHLGAFVDGYFALNTNFPKPQVGTSALRAFDGNNGFSLSWFGLDARYDAGPLRLAADVRLGPSAARLAGDDANHGLQFLKQAYVRFAPDALDGALAIDFGKLDSIFGGEVTDSQRNLNYSRGFLYTLGRPRFLTGLVVSYRLIEPLTLRALIVNGWNRTVDNNAGKSFGLQAEYAHAGDPGGSPLVAKLGYLGGPEQSDIGVQQCPTGLAFDPDQNACTTSGVSATYPVDRSSSNTQALRHLIDAVVVARPLDALELVLNGDLGMDRVAIDGARGRTFRSVKWYGVMLAGGYAFTDVWRAALRGEYYGDPDAYTCGATCLNAGVASADLMSTTATIEARPVSRLSFKLDGRWDHGALTAAAGRSSAVGPGVFPVLRTNKPDQVTITLGVVASTD